MCCCSAAHSPDNSFMGFVVEQHLNDSHVQHLERQNKAVVYGKKEYMWEVCQHHCIHTQHNNFWLKAIHYKSG